MFKTNLDKLLRGHLERCKVDNLGHKECRSYFSSKGMRDELVSRLEQKVVKNSALKKTYLFLIDDNNRLCNKTFQPFT